MENKEKHIHQWVFIRRYNAGMSDSEPYMLCEFICPECGEKKEIEDTKDSDY